MIKKLSFMLAALLMFAVGSFAQETVTIGTGDAQNGFVPSFRYYKYAVSQSIYLASEIGKTNGKIESISYMPTKTNVNARLWEVYLGETDKSSFSSESDLLSASELTLVYSGTTGAFTTNEWVTLTFSSPYIYKGGNLVVVVRDLTGSYSGYTNSDQFKCNQVSSGRSMYSYRDDGEYSVKEAEYSLSYVPYIQLGISSIPADYCYTPKNFAVNNVTTSSAAFSWAAGGSETAWRLEITTAADANWTNAKYYNLANTSFSVSDLNALTSYKARVRSNCSSSNTSSWKEIAFTTPCATMASDAIPYSYGFEDALPFSCWTVVSGTASIIPNNTSGYYKYIYTNSGDNSLKIQSAVVALPAIDMNLNKLRLRLSSASTAYSSPMDIEVGVISNVADASTFKPLDTIKSAYGYNGYYIYNTEVSKWVVFDTNLSAATNRIALRIGGNSYYNTCYIDDVTIDTLLACPETISGTLASVDSLLESNTATLTFVDTIKSHEGWNLYYKTVGAEEYSVIALQRKDTVGKDTMVVKLDNLSAATSYQAYVSIACDGGAELSNVVTFMTDQLTIDLAKLENNTYFLDFDENVPAKGELKIDNRDITGEGTSMTSGVGANKWNISSETGNTGKSLCINDGVTYNVGSTSKTFATFKIKFLNDIDNYQLTFDYKTKGENEYDYLTVFMIDENVDPASVFTANDYSWNPESSQKFLVNTNSSSDWKADWTEYAITLDSKDLLKGKTKQLVFAWVNDNYANANNMPAAIDNLTIKAGLDCSLAVNKKDTTINIFLCAGEDVNGMTPGDYTTTLQTVPWGCDSVVTLHVAMAEDITIEDPITICSNSSYTVPNGSGKEYTEAGSYIDSVATDGGCYNLVHFTLDVKPAYWDSVHAEICDGESYEMSYFDYDKYNAAVAALGEGEELPEDADFTVTNRYNETREYIINMKSIDGCDSVIKLDLQVNPIFKQTIAHTMCQGEVYSDNGFYKNETGFYTLALKTEAGCDSIVSLDLTVNPVYDTVIYDTVNTSALVYNHNGKKAELSQAGLLELKDTLNTVAGCDSIITYNVTVLGSYIDTTHLHDTVCFGDSVAITYFNYARQADSVALAAAEERELDAELNFVDTIFYKAAGIYTQEFVSATGSDSVVKVGLTILPQIAVTTIDTAICFNGSFVLNNETYTEAGVYYDTIQSVLKFGCDSVLAYNVTIRPNYVIRDTIVINAGDEWTTVEGKKYNATGDYTVYDTVTKVKAGNVQCDSIHTVNLTVRPVVKDTTIVSTFCKGNVNVQPGATAVEGFTLGTDGNWYKENHIPFTVANTNGEYGDSILNVMVIKVNNFDTVITASICSNATFDLTKAVPAGDTYVSGDGKTFNTTGAYNATFSRSGCEYDVTLNLTVNPVKETNLTATICQDSVYKENGFNVTGTKAGTFTYKQEKKTTLGCDSVITLTLTVLPITNTTETLTAKQGETKVWRGKTLNTEHAGVFTYYDTTDNANGCKEMTTLTFTVDTVYYTENIVTVFCNGDQPTATQTEGFTKKEDGNWYSEVKLVASDGNDSILLLVLKVNPTPVRTIDTTICKASLPFTYKDKKTGLTTAKFTGLTAAGTYTDTVKLESGCDSVTVLNLAVNDNIIKEYSGEYCANSDELPVTWQVGTTTKILSTAGVYEITVEGKNGECDTIHRYTLKVNTVDSVEVVVNDICESPSDNDFVAKETVKGVTKWVKNVTFQKANTGCDSVVVLTIYQHPVYDSIIKDTICQGSEYNKNNFVVTAEETALASASTLTRVQDIQTETYGCDSTVTLQLYVKPAYTIALGTATVITDSMAVGETYKLNGFDFTATEQDITSEDEDGNYNYLVKQLDLVSSLGCDSAVVLNLKVFPAIPVSTFTVEQCQTQINGNVKPGINGTYTNHRTAANGLCDTVTITQIVVNPMYDTIIKDTICTGGVYEKSSITVHNVLTDADETYTFAAVTLEDNGTNLLTADTTIQTNKGCALNMHYQITVLPTKKTVIYDTICANGQSIVPGFEDKNATGTYELMAQTTVGTRHCDSLVVLNLYVRPNYDVVVNDTLHLYDNNTYVNAEYGYILTPDVEIDAENPQVVNLDDIVIVNTQTELGCDSVVTLKLAVVPFKESWETITVCSEAAAENTQLSLQRFVTADGIDSIVNYAVEIKPLETLTIDETICQGTSFTYNNKTYNATGTYTDKITEDGCDRNVVINLVVSDALTETVNATICEGESYYFNGQAYTESGTYTANTVADGGCDKVMTLNLTVNPKVTKSVTATICEGESYTFNGESYSQTGVYTANLKNVNGCDSIVTLALTVNPKKAETIAATICAGSSYSFNGQNLTTAGTYTKTVESVKGCDSVVTLVLTVTPEIHSYQTVTICSGSSYSFNGQNLTTAGTYNATYTTNNGCDSVVTLTLNVNNTITSSVEATICEGTVYQFGGQPLTEAGTYTQSLQSVNGCDSIVTLTLTINPIATETIDATICEGTSYEFGDETLTVGGTYTRTMTTATGCDSVITLNLTVSPKLYKTMEVSICAGETYEFNGQQLSATGVYTSTVVSEGGCDSVTTLILTVNPVENTTITYALRLDEVYTLNGKSYTELGTYYDTLQNVNGCDSIITLVLYPSSIDEVSDAVSVSVYPNPTQSDATLSVEGLTSDAQVIVTDIQGKVIYTETLPQGQTTLQIRSASLASGTYYIRVISDEGIRTQKLIRR